ncbi:MAG: hypothetical protein P4L91_20735 [Burkholderiaceae bacterium]|nr:hypothetical protein [Burkholderiaceae bacterium]
MKVVTENRWHGSIGPCSHMDYGILYQARQVSLETAIGRRGKIPAIVALMHKISPFVSSCIKVGSDLHTNRAYPRANFSSRETIASSRLMIGTSGKSVQTGNFRVESSGCAATAGNQDLARGGFEVSMAWIVHYRRWVEMVAFDLKVVKRPNHVTK